MKIPAILLSALLLLSLPATAQRRKTPPRLTPEQQARQAKLERMRANTQRIMFVDSFVVDKQQFLQAYHLAPEVGQLARFQDIFNTRNQPNAYVYVNELGNRCYLSQEAPDSTVNLYTSETLDNRWSRPVALRGINDDREFRRVNFPFMMGDGQTFYFAAEGDEGLGGYDIYVTRYDAETGSFLHPANIGMPFNSEANDYMYVVDEYSNLGWFATDRNQTDGKVCIYVFLPSPTRQTYSSSGLSTEEIAALSRIDRIADTWADTTALVAARQRLHDVATHKQEKQQSTDGSFQFVINDEVTYSRLSDFQAQGNAQRYQQLTALQKRYQRLLSTLQRARDYYATATAEERAELQSEILASEQRQHELYHEIRNAEKTIRNAENILLSGKPKK